MFSYLCDCLYDCKQFPGPDRLFVYRLTAGLASLIFLSGCGGGSSSSPTPSPSPSHLPSPSPTPTLPPPVLLPSPSPSPSPLAVAIDIAPPSATVAPSAQQQFNATVSNTANQAVSWSVVEGATGGSVDANGLYTASPTSGTYHVMAKSNAASSKTTTATITVPLVVSVTPATATTVSGIVSFKAAVNSLSNQTVTWKVQEDAGGTITDKGIYTPPPLGGVFHVVAISAVDGTTQGVATVDVQSGGATGVIQ